MSDYGHSSVEGAYDGLSNILRAAPRFEVACHVTHKPLHTSGGLAPIIEVSACASEFYSLLSDTQGEVLPVLGLLRTRTLPPASFGDEGAGASHEFWSNGPREARAHAVGAIRADTRRCDRYRPAQCDFI